MNAIAQGFVVVVLVVFLVRFFTYLSDNRLK